MTRSTITRIATVFIALIIPFAGRADELGEDLFTAVRGNEVATVQNLLDRGVDIDGRDEYGNTALMITAAYGYAELAEMLVERGAEVNLAGRIGHTALSYAAEEGHAEIAEMLVANGANVNTVNDYGNRVGSLAAGRGHGEIAALVQAQRQIEEPVVVEAIEWAVMIALGLIGMIAAAALVLDGAYAFAHMPNSHPVR